MAVEPYASHTQIDRVVNDDDGVFLQQVQCKSLPGCGILGLMLMLSILAGAMNVVDAEPLDGVDFKNGVLAYITLVGFMSACLSLTFVRHY